MQLNANRWKLVLWKVSYDPAPDGRTRNTFVEKQRL
jgi:hypothetical protein